MRIIVNEKRQEPPSVTPSPMVGGGSRSRRSPLHWDPHTGPSTSKVRSTLRPRSPGILHEIDETASTSAASLKSTPSNTTIQVHSKRVQSDLSVVSDLSGSYGHGSPHNGGGHNKGNHKVPRQITSLDHSHAYSSQQPWRQGYVLSNRVQEEPLPEVSIVINDCTGGIEMVNNEQDKHDDCSADSLLDSDVGGAECSSERMPVILCLMHPSHKMYEILQLWINSETDTVRDVLQSIQRYVGDKKWNQDYDGLVQLRGKKSSQLIHCLGVSKYDVQPNEVWMAKPWSMSVGLMTSYTNSLLEHLSRIGVVYRYGKKKSSVLSLSPKAKSRIYAPDGILKHYHAGEFLSFNPPLEPLYRPRITQSVPKSIPPAVSNDDDCHSQVTFGSDAGHSLSPHLSPNQDDGKQNFEIVDAITLTKSKSRDSTTDGQQRNVKIPLLLPSKNKKSDEESTVASTPEFKLKKKRMGQEHSPKILFDTIVDDDDGGRHRRLKSFTGCFKSLVCIKDDDDENHQETSYRPLHHRLQQGGGGETSVVTAGSTQFLSSMSQQGTNRLAGITEGSSSHCEDECDTVVSHDTFASLINRRSPGKELCFI